VKLAVDLAGYVVIADPFRRTKRRSFINGCQWRQVGRDEIFPIEQVSGGGCCDHNHSHRRERKDREDSSDTSDRRQEQIDIEGAP
jgi:hypothetical protein